MLIVYTCMEIPAEFKKVQMNFDTPICFSLPDDRDEGDFFSYLCFFPR